MRIPEKPAATRLNSTAPSTAPSKATTETNTETKTETSAPEPSWSQSTPLPEAQPQTSSLLRVLGQSRIGHALLGFASFAGAVAPISKQVLDGLSSAPTRLATDTRTVTTMQARTESALRLDLFTRTDHVDLDEVQSLTRALDKGALTGPQSQRLIQDLGKKRGFTGEAIEAITVYFGAKDATLAAPRDKHADSAVAVAMTGPLVAHDTARVSDVKQGAIGDCYFAASAAAIVARDPSFPHRIIEERQTVTGDRYYAVQLSANFLNLPQQTLSIEVADSVWAKNGRALYGKNTGGGHWFQVVEQAGAKLQGNFDQLETGFGFAGLSRLTGLPTGFRLTTAASDPEAVFASLKKHNDAGDAMTTGAHKFPDAAFVAAHPKVFSTMHEYAILDVTGTSAKDGHVKLYNPHGYVLDITIQEYLRNFLGFSYVDLGQQHPTMPKPAAVEPAILRRDPEIAVDSENDAKRPRLS